MRLDKLARQLKTQGREQKRSGKHLATRLRQSDRGVRPQDQDSDPSPRRRNQAGSGAQPARYWDGAAWTEQVEESPSDPAPAGIERVDDRVYPYFGG